MKGIEKAKAKEVVWAVLIGFLLLVPTSLTALGTLVGEGKNIKGNNDLVVNTLVVLDRSAAPSGVLGMDGNITINAGGNLTVKNIEIQFLQDAGFYPTTPPKKYFLKVNAGGVLYLENSSITVSTMMVNPYLKFNLSCEGGKIVMKNAKLAFPGYIYLLNGELYLNNSQITGLSEMPSVWQNDVAKMDDNDDGPIITAINSKMYVADSVIDKYYENVNIVDFQLTPKDFPGYIELQPGQTMTISQIDVSDITYDKLSRVSLQYEYTTTPEYNGTGSFQVSYNSGQSWQNLPITPQPGTTVGDVVPLAVNTLNGLMNLRFRFTHTGTDGNISITRFDLIVRPEYEFNLTLAGTTQMTVINSNISFDWDSPSLAMGTSNKIVLYDSAILELLNVSLDEAETPPLDASGHGQKYAPAIVTFNNSQVFVYRWARIPVYDQNRMPIANAQLTGLEYTPSSSMVQYSIASQANNLNAHPMLKMYLNAKGVTNKSDQSGIITYPIASDYINITTLPNSLFIGSYNASCIVGSKRGSGIITLPAYPDMVEADNIFLTSPVGITIDLPNLKINSVLTTPAQPLKGDATNLTAKVENNGLADAKGVCVRFIVNGEEVGTTQALDIPQGAVQDFVYSFRFDSSGSFLITAIVDPDNTVSEMDENDNTLSKTLAIGGRPSLIIEKIDVLVGGIPSGIVNINQTVEIRATVWNYGDGIASNVMVEFRTENGLIGKDTIATIPIGQREDAKVTWTPTGGKGYTITATILSSTPPEAQTDMQDNSLSQTVMIAYPELKINMDRLSFSEEPAEDRSTKVEVEIYNDGNGFASNVVVNLKCENEVVNTTTIPRIDAKASAKASFGWNIAIGYGGKKNITVEILSCAEGIQPISETTSIYVKYAPKLSMEPKLWFYDEENNAISSVQPGTKIIVKVNITNSGDLESSELTVDFYLDTLTKSSYIGKATLQKIAGKSTAVCEFAWLVSVQELNRNHTIYAKVNNTQMIANNTIFVEKLNIGWEVEPNIAREVKAGQDLVITGKVRASMQKEMRAILHVMDESGKDVGTFVGQFASDGSGQFYIYPRLDKPGNYTLLVEISGDEINTLYSQYYPVTVTGGAAEGIPFFLPILIVVIVVVVVIVALFLGISRMGIGKLGECGECGAPIPENATKCPHCGAEFETSTVRCSECGAWIPATAKTCPECGTVFTGKKIATTSAERTLRQEYEAYVDKYRAQAKRELGDSFSETAFWRWWRTQPSYMTYNQWLQKARGAKVGTQKCPRCGAINEISARVCYRCGASLIAEPTMPPSQPPQPPQYPQPYQPPVYAPPTQPPIVQQPKAEAPVYTPPPKPVVLKATPPPPPTPTAPPAAPIPPKKVIRKPETVEPMPEKPAGKLCPKCGKEISAEFVVCPYCGAIVR